MARQVGVVNAPPVYVAGLRASPDDGFTYQSIVDAEVWLRQFREPTVLVGIRSADDLHLVVELKANAPDSVVVTVVDDYSLETVRDSLAAGASGAISRDAAADDVALALAAAISNSTVMPLDLARRLAEHTRQDRPADVDQSEVGWLQSLAERKTVAQLGDSAGYSEREMYRRLRRLYRKMGVGGRTEALIMASRLGWIR